MLVNNAVDYLIIGNITKDIIPDGAMLGGTSSYSAVTAHRLEQRVGVVSRVAHDAPSLEVLDGIAFHALPAEHSTTFENVYQNGKRFQKWLADGGKISMDDVPSAWRTAPIVHLAPIAQEISPALCAEFSDNLVGVTIQGWLRGKDAEGNVRYRPHPALLQWVHHADIVVLSLSDFFGDRMAMEHLLAQVPLGVETLGSGGCMVYHNGEKYHVPVDAQPETDPTGAGDIFAAAFFIRFHQTRDWLEAARFANACASISVTRLGVLGVPTIAEIEVQKLKMYGAASR